jgi:hypothetical protein
MTMKRLVMMLSAGTVALMLSSGAWASGAEHVDSAQIAAAKTTADHEAIAKSYDAEAVAADAKATAHESMAKTYRTGGAPKGSNTAHTAMAGHCEKLVKQYRGVAEENRLLAAAHRQMAKDCCAQK